MRHRRLAQKPVVVVIPLAAIAIVLAVLGTWYLSAGPSEPQLGDVKVNVKDGQNYVWIPAGTFVMGCSPSDNDCEEQEKPAHAVSITKGFWLGQTPVTVGAWKRYAQRSGKAMPPEPKHVDHVLNPGWVDDRQPMVLIPWAEAAAFCSAAGGRLPTEAEWEYAARAGSTGARYGNLDDIAGYGDNSGANRIDSATIFKGDREHFDARVAANGNTPKPVGTKQPNAWKLYDMLGNAWQWTADGYGANYYQHSEATDPSGIPTAELRTRRGGAWISGAGRVRVSRRLGMPATDADLTSGVRCVGE